MKIHKAIFTIVFFLTSSELMAGAFGHQLSQNSAILKKNQSLDKFLAVNGYESNKINWKLITMGLNQLTNKSLVNRDRDLKIKLPTKQKISKTLRFSRTIASSKLQCELLSRKYLKTKLNKEAKYYSSYIDMISERKIKVRKGQKVIDILKADGFEYRSLKTAYLHTLRDNKLKKNIINKSGFITLPFCGSKDIRRSIAALNTNITEIKPRNKSLLPIPMNIGLSVGQFAVDQDSKNLSMNFLKLQASGKYKLNSDYLLTGKVSAASFTNIKYSEATGETNTTNFYPEFGVSLNTRSGAFSYGVSYDRINYFLIKDESDSITLEPNQLNKLSANGFYSFTDELGVFANAGFMMGFDSENITGFDLSLGASYAFGDQNRFKVSPLMYYGSVNSDLSSEAETSNAFALSVSVDF